MNKEMLYLYVAWSTLQSQVAFIFLLFSLDNRIIADANTGEKKQTNKKYVFLATLIIF